MSDMGLEYRWRVAEAHKLAVRFGYMHAHMMLVLWRVGDRIALAEQVLDMATRLNVSPMAIARLCKPRVDLMTAVDEADMFERVFSKR